MSTSEIDQQIESAISAVMKIDGLKDIYFVACGGSLALMMPNKYLIDRESKTLSSEVYNSAEFVQRAPARLGPDSLVVVSSMGGTTPETVEAAEFARKHGALTVGLTTDPTSPMGQAVDHCIEYELSPSQANDKAAACVFLKLLFRLLAEKEGNEKYPQVATGVSKITSVVDSVVASHADRIRDFGQQYKRESVIYTMASGSNYGPAYSFAICILMEMQWIHSNAIHAGEYFHGPFEITDFDTPIITLLGLDATRPQEERALAFSKKFSDRNIVLDAKEFDLSSLPEVSHEYVTQIIFGYLLRAYANRLAEDKGHPLTVRRYMWKMDY